MTHALPLAILVMLLVTGCSWSDEVPPGAELLSQGRVIDTGDALPPQPDAPGWRSVELTDTWPARRRMLGTAGWYELPFRVESPQDVLYGLYLPILSQNAEARVNGHPIGSGGDMRDPPTRNWNRPLYFSFSGSLLQPGRNVVEVRLRTSTSSFGLLAPVLVGLDSALRPRFETRSFVQVRLREILTVLVLATGILLAFVSTRTTDLGGVRWMVAATLLWALSSADALVPDPPISLRAWQWWNQMTLIGSAVCAVLSIHRSLAMRRRKIETTIFAAVAVIALLLATVSDLLIPVVALANALLGAAIAAYILLFVIRNRHRSFNLPSWLVVFASLSIFALVVHDFLLGGGFPVPFRFLLFPYVGSLIVLTISVFVIRRFLRALRETEALNRELESRVAEKHAELERNYARLALLERDRVVAAERSRLTRDMHDGVGGQLVAALAMVEHGAFGGDEVAHVLRDAIDDLRLVIDSLDPGETDLPTLLGLVRERLEPRMLRHGVQFVWKVEDVPHPAGFGAQEALSALRIVQESITNVMKHARARTVEVKTGSLEHAEGGPGVFVLVRDDGVGFAPDAVPGRGLRNMRRRAADLGGRLDVETGSSGTTVRLWLPLEAGASVPPISD